MQRHLDIRLLRSFCQVADTGGFTAAARQLCLTQSAVSAHIRRLETQLGTRLLERDSRHVELTGTGEALLGHARHILACNDDLLQEMDLALNAAGPVRLGIPSDYAAYLLPDVLSRFNKEHPDAQTELVCDLSVDLLDELRQGHIDLALVTRQPRSSGGRLVRRERLVWAAAADFGSAPAGPDAPLPLALFPPGYCIFRENALAALRRIGRSWRTVCTSRSLSGIRATVSSGLAATVVAESTISPDMRVLGKEHSLPALPSVELALHTGGEAHMTKQIEALARCICDTLGNIPPVIE